jgi:hypothetical protein
MVVEAGGGVSLLGDPRPPIHTVESLFAEVRQLLNSHADEINLTFDPRFRYPTTINIDYDLSRQDDGFTWVAELRVLEPQDLDDLTRRLGLQGLRVRSERQSRIKSAAGGAM